MISCPAKTRTSNCVICLHDFEYTTRKRQERRLCSPDCAREAFRRCGALVHKAESERRDYVARTGITSDEYQPSRWATLDLIMTAQDIVYRGLA